jgi:hypothetical protein
MCGVLGWMARDVMLSFAGKATFAQVLISVLGSIRISVAVAWGAAGACAIGWGLCAKSKRKLQKHNLPRLGELEKIIHPQRTTSGLNINGEAPEDVLK